MGNDKVYTITFGGNETQFQIKMEGGQQDMASDQAWKIIKDEFIHYVTGVHPRTTEVAKAIEYAKASLSPEALAEPQETPNAG